jgi:hypothetical protein
VKKLLLVCCVLAAAPAALAGVWMNPGFYSYHFEHDKELKNVNTGLGAEVTINDTYSATLGVFHNSDHQTSRYVGLYVMPYRIGAFKAGAAAGVFNGYPKVRDGEWFPALIPAVAIEGQRLGLNMSFVPKFGNRLHSAVIFQIKYNIAP